jgi:cyclohexyl-isocyanide hydratase
MTCGMILFPGMTQLDVTGPYEVLSRVPQMQVLLMGVDRQPVRTEHGMILMPDCSFAEAPKLDVLVVPGGTGINDALLDRRYLTFVEVAGSGAKWVTSVCTGALLLAASGLLGGFRATTHWRSIEFLGAFGAAPVADERVVVDRNRVTAAGASAGIDLALLLAAKICGEAAAQQIQLAIEYDPSPLFASGHPRTAPTEKVAAAKRLLVPAIERRVESVRTAAQRLNRQREMDRLLCM